MALRMDGNRYPMKKLSKHIYSMVKLTKIDEGVGERWAHRCIILKHGKMQQGLI